MASATSPTNLFNQQQQPRRTYRVRQSATPATTKLGENDQNKSTLNIHSDGLRFEPSIPTLSNNTISFSQTINANVVDNLFAKQLEEEKQKFFKLQAEKGQLLIEKTRVEQENLYLRKQYDEILRELNHERNMRQKGDKIQSKIVFICFFFFFFFFF
jgi:hypothetical protein